MFRSAFFWIGMIFVPAFTLLPDVFYKSLQRSMYKTETQAIQEREAKNQDVETIIRTSKISETARLLKSAFTFTRFQAPPTAYRKFCHTPRVLWDFIIVLSFDLYLRRVRIFTRGKWSGQTIRSYPTV